MPERGTPAHEDERAREQWMQKLTDAWNAAVDAAVETAKTQGRSKAEEDFVATWQTKCRELGVGEITLKWLQGIFATTTKAHEGRNYIFVRADKADLNGALVRVAFEYVSVEDQSKARVRKPASVESAIFEAVNGDIIKLDEHEFEKGEIS